MEEKYVVVRCFEFGGLILKETHILANKRLYVTGNNKKNLNTIRAANCCWLLEKRIQLTLAQTQTPKFPSITAVMWFRFTYLRLP